MQRGKVPHEGVRRQLEDLRDREGEGVGGADARKVAEGRAGAGGGVGGGGEEVVQAERGHAGEKQHRDGQQQRGGYKESLDPGAPLLRFLQERVL